MRHIGNVSPARRVRNAALGLFLGFSMCGGSEIAAQETEKDREVEANAPVEIAEGLWPSPKLMRLMLSRWAEEAAYEYSLDDQQRDKARRAVVDRWTKFLDENREEIQPLANQFLEMRMELKPPAKTQVQDWAKRARPFFEMARKQVEEGTSEFREVLRPDQRLKFEVDAMKLKVGMGFVEQKFSQWEKGEFEADEFWEPTGAQREERRDERRRRRREREARDAEAEKQVDDEAVDHIDAELDSWQQYVADFISTYGLDSGQRSTVLSCLTELRDRAIAHRDRHREEITRLEGRIASNTGTEEELKDIKSQLQRLYGPIDDMFKELQTRIAQVPTGDQRATAVSAPQSERARNTRTPSSKSQAVQPNEPASVEEPQVPPKDPANPLP